MQDRRDHDPGDSRGSRSETLSRRDRAGIRQCPPLTPADKKLDNKNIAFWARILFSLSISSIIIAVILYLLDITWDITEMTVDGKIIITVLLLYIGIVLNAIFLENRYRLYKIFRTLR
jgi:type IV secretory pathway TrbL component